MKIEMLEKNKDNVSFILKDASVQIANTIRRAIVNEVPTMAVEDVAFTKNSSALFDEMVAHRMGLVPLKTDLKSYDFTEDCSCKGEGCAKCEVVGTLKVKEVKVPTMINASEINFKDPAIKPAFPEMPIVFLLKGQDIECEITATLGKGKEHSKWIPAHVHYKYLPVIEIGKNVENAEEVAKSCPVDVFEVKSGKLNVKNLNACHLCGACVDVSDGEVKLNEKDTDFIFYIETFGQLDVDEIITKAVEVIDAELKELESQLK